MPPQSLNRSNSQTCLTEARAAALFRSSALAASDAALQSRETLLR
jgi:hypothetical protein